MTRSRNKNPLALYGIAPYYGDMKNLKRAAAISTWTTIAGIATGYTLIAWIGICVLSVAVTAIIVQYQERA